VRVIVCGAGQVGMGIATQLVNEGDDITIIDISAERIAEIAGHHEVCVIQGEATHPAVLEAAKAAEADMIIAATPSDEVNMLACYIAKALFDVPLKICRVRNQGYLQPQYEHMLSQDYLGIDVIISPEREVAKKIFERYDAPGVSNILPFMSPQVLVIALAIHHEAPIYAYSIERLSHLLSDYQVAILGVVRNDAYLCLGARDALQDHDHLYLALATAQVNDVMQRCGYHRDPVERVVIVGGGSVGLYLASMFEQTRGRVSVTLIEANSKRAEKVAPLMRQTTVIQGNCLEQEIFDEAQINEADVLIAVTNDDRVNMMVSLLAKRAGCKSAATLVNQYNIYGGLATAHGIDVIINPGDITVSSIVRHAHRRKICTMHTIAGGQVGVLEMELQAGARIENRTIADIDFPSGVVLGMHIRDQQLRIAHDSLVLEAGDRLILLCPTSCVKQIEAMFAGKPLV
jgi:trk system potassium uptake protein TrkA